MSAMPAAVYTKHQHAAQYSPASTRASPTSLELDQLLITLSNDQIRYLKALLSSDINLSDLRCQLDDVSHKDVSPLRNDAQNHKVAARLHDLLEKEEEACVSCRSREVLMSQLEAEVLRLNEKLACESARFAAEKEEWREAIENGDSSIFKSDIKELRKSLGESKRLIQSLKASHAAEIATLNRQRNWSSNEETETETAVLLKRENTRLTKAVEEADRLVADLRLTVLRLASRPGDEAEECDLSSAYAKVVAEKIEAEKVASALQHSMNSLRHEHTEASVLVESLKRQLDFSRTDKVQMSEQIDTLERERASLRQALLESQAKTHTLQSEADGLKSGLQTEIDNLQQSLLSSKQTAASLTAQLNETAHAKAAAEADVKRLSEELTRLRCGSDGELLRLRESAEEAENNIRKMEGHLVAVTNALEASERRTATLSVEVDRLRSIAANSEAEAAQLKRKLVNAVEESRQEVRSARVELSKLRGSKEDSDRIIANLHADIRRLNANKEETERTLTLLQSEIAPLRAARDEALQKVVDLEIEVTRLLEDPSSKEQDPHALQGDSSRLQDELDRSNQRIQMLQDELDRRTEEIELLTVDKELAIQELQQQHQAAIEQDQHQYHLELQSLQAELQQAHETARKIVPVSYDSGSTHEDLSGEVEALTQRNAELGEKVEELEEMVLNVSMLEEHIVSLESDLRESGKREAELRDELKSLRTKVEELDIELRSSESREDQLRKELDRSRAETTTAAEALVTVKSELQSKLEELQEESDKLRLISEAKETLQEKYEAMEKELEESQKQHEALKIDLAEARKAAEVAELALNESLEEPTGLEAPLKLSDASPEEQLRKLKVALKQKTSILNDERAKALMLDVRMKEKEELVKNVQRQMLAVEEAWKHEFETYEAHLHKTCNQVTDLTNERERLLSDLAKQAKEVNALKSLIERNNDELEAVQSFKKQQKTLTKTIQVLESKCDQLRKRIVELESCPPKRVDGLVKIKSVALRSPHMLLVASVAVLCSIVGYLSGSSTI